MRYLKKFIGSLILLLLVVVAVTFAVSNRAMVTFSLWPLPVDPSLQLGATVLAAFALGLIAGTAVMSLSRMKSRRQARSSERRAETLEKVVASEASSAFPMPVAATPDQARRKALSGQ